MLSLKRNMFIVRHEACHEVTIVIFCFEKLFKKGEGVRVRIWEG